MNHLEYYRRKAGLTQAELSEKIGADRSYIGKVENGKDMPGEKWKRVADILGCTVDELLGKTR